MSNGLHGAYKNGGWALVDANDKPLTECKYNFVTECGEGYFRAELGARKNLLRSDGTEVLSEWFHDVFNVENGFFTQVSDLEFRPIGPVLGMRRDACCLGLSTRA
jgi:hypothetical protein